MKGTNLGELEEIVLLVVANLFDNAYGILIKQEIEAKCNRTITISTVTPHRNVAVSENYCFGSPKLDKPHS